MPNQLGKIGHIVQVMLENRSFDQMLGFLYADRKSVSLAGQPFDGLTGDERNPDDTGRAVSARRLRCPAQREGVELDAAHHHL
jgi:phospholipase C